MLVLPFVARNSEREALRKKINPLLQPLRGNTIAQYISLECQIDLKGSAAVNFNDFFLKVERRQNINFLVIDRFSSSFTSSWLFPVQLLIE